jgi:predicted transcriptional regulator YheO
MKIIFSPVKGWCEKRLSQKSPVDEKRSGRPSILRKVQKMAISKSLDKRGQSTRKLASKLTIRGLQCSKDTIHRYLRLDLWSLFMQEACFMQNLQKSDCK